MKYLAVSASQKRASLSFFVNSKPIINIEAERDIQPSQWFSSAILMIGEIYNDFLDNLSFVAVDIGPGSFTGIKVGIAFVKGLLQKNNIPVVCVNSLEANAILGPENKKIAIIKNARKGLYFFAFYENKSTYINEVIKPSTLTKEQITETINFLGDLIIYTDTDDFDDIIKKTIIKNTTPLSAGVGIIGFGRFINGNFINEKEIKPLYLREPDAVVNFNIINKE